MSSATIAVRWELQPSARQRGAHHVSDHPDANRITSVRAEDTGWTHDLFSMWGTTAAWSRSSSGANFKVKYKAVDHSGVLWIVIQPFFTVMLNTVIFGGLAKMDSEGQPYGLYNYVGMLPWLLFSASLPAISSSLIGNTHLIQKVHFPRAILPIYGALTCLPDFVMLLGIQFLLLICLGHYPTINALWLPLFILWALALSLAVGFFLAALSARWRDASVGVAFLLQIWYFATPIVYSPNAVGTKLRWIMMINPMGWIVRGAAGDSSAPSPAPSRSSLCRCSPPSSLSSPATCSSGRRNGPSPTSSEPPP